MINLWWIGEQEGDRAVLERVRQHLEVEFSCAVRPWPGRERPERTFDPRRRQHSSRAMLEWLLRTAPVDGARVIGITDVDLFIPVLTFVFGEAQLEGTTAVVSSARLSQPGDRAGSIARLAKECVHELGHTFGLLHCSTPGCVMTRSASVRAVDAKGARLCPECRARYQALQQDGLHVYREDEDSHCR